MRDCQNADIRDLLPDLAVERLSGADLHRVVAHVAACAACAAEVELLRDAGRALRRAAPEVDVGGIVAALPKPPVAATGPTLVPGSDSAPRRTPAIGPAWDRTSRRRTWTTWRIAAVLSTVAVGSLSVAVLRSLISPRTTLVSSSAGARPNTQVGTSAGHGLTTSIPTASHPESGGPSATTPSMSTGGDESTSAAAASVGAAITAAGGVSDLSEGEVEGLLNDLDGLEATPSADPEPPALGLHAMVSP